MKFILLLVVVGVVIWMINSRSRKPLPPASSPRPDRESAALSPMLACARCGVHVPQAEAVTDSAGRPYCGAPHRDAGPGST